MHETGLLKDIIQKVNEIVRAENASQVSEITINLGSLSQVSEEHFRYHFKIESKGTILENTNLKVAVNADTSDPLSQEIVLSSLELE